MMPSRPGEQTREPAPVDAAVDWSIRRATGLTAQETAELLQWLAADPRRRARLAEAEAAVTILRRAGSSGGAGRIIGELRARREARRWRWRAGAWSAAGLAAALVLAFLPKWPGREADFRRPPGPSVVARPDRQSLPDGSVVHLNAGAEFRAAFDAARRRVELVQGEAFFTVVADPARPFVVTAAGVEVRAVGTEFSVRHRSGRVEVLVTEGRVAVATEAVVPAAAPEPLLLAAGSRVSVPVSGSTPAPVGPESVSAEELARALAWRSSRVEFSSTPLGEALALFNVENRTQLAVDEVDLKELRVGGISWTNDPEAFAKLLEMSFGLVAERPGPDRIVLRRAR